MSLHRITPLPPVEDAQDLIRHIGAQVRAARKGKGLSRRALSDLSGVSPRYLAQIEGEGGNISVGVLLKIATALELDVRSLFVQGGLSGPEVAKLAALYEAADTQLRARVLQLLGAGGGQPQKARRICLLGLRGAGKSTLGALAARDLAVPFVELNHMVEDRAGVPMSEIIALYGDAGHRRIEAEALEDLIANHEHVILAVAGGIVSDAQTYARLHASFHTIWLRAAPQEHMDRVRAQGDMRPMAGNPRAMDQLRDILSKREALYAQADFTVDTSGRALEHSLSELKDVIETQGLLTGGGPNIRRL